MRFFKGVVVSELLALWVDFFYKLGVKFFPKGFFIAIPLFYLSLRVARSFRVIQGETIPVADWNRHWRNGGSVTGMVSGGEFSLEQSYCVSIGPISFPWGLSYSGIFPCPYGCAKDITKSCVHLYDNFFRHHIHWFFLWRSQSSEALVFVSPSLRVCRLVLLHLPTGNSTISRLKGNTHGAAYLSPTATTHYSLRLARASRSPAPSCLSTWLPRQ